MPSAVIAASSSGDNVVVAGVAGYAVRVLSYTLSFSAAVNAKWMSDTGGGAVALSGSGLHYGVGTSPAPVVVPAPGPNARGLFQTAAGKALNLNLSGAVPVGGQVLYELAAQ
jgi:hypothetical protein